MSSEMQIESEEKVIKIYNTERERERQAGNWE
jgi:hypothetical protein